MALRLPVATSHAQCPPRASLHQVPSDTGLCPDRPLFISSRRLAMTSNSMICPSCELGNLVPSVFADDFRHNDSSVHVEGLECYVCDRCGADPVYPDQIRRNQLRIADRSEESRVGKAGVSTWRSRWS